VQRYKIIHFFILFSVIDFTIFLWIVSTYTTVHFDIQSGETIFKKSLCIDD